MPESGRPVLLHNPRCSKSRDALAMLRGRGVEVTVRDYLEEPLDGSDVLALVAKIEGSAATLLRSKEPEYLEFGLSDASSPDEVARAIAAHPTLLERPILIVGERAAIGRPLEALERLLDAGDPRETRRG